MAYEEDRISPEAAMRRVRDLLAQMTEEDGNDFLGMLAEAIADNGEPAEDAARRLGHRLGRDDPPDFPGKPETGGTMVPLQNLPESERLEALDRASRRRANMAKDQAIDSWLRRSGSPRLAFDAASKGFAERFPSAARIGTHGFPAR